ncbi:hypothetical protein RhiirA4_427187 [Rhizophagus irregularis]|uniref:SWIM-type domain-containing protein n=1 Tax=Rhizophagus irregularis TaxID=588596 RepID=A0A2I1H817_9GLOM|nr:hypothetical protein RhiirA4_427187 [Rhizophagus irregularis]
MAKAVEYLDSQMQKEELNATFMEWKYKSICIVVGKHQNNFFSDINALIKKYFSPHIVAEIHKQMCESVLYKCEKMSLEDANNFDNDQMDQEDELPELGSDQEEVNNIEDHYDYQTYLKALLNSVSGKSIKEIWRITPYMIPSSYQHIVTFEDGTHICTCLLLVSHGIICRHYFKLMVENLNALFHLLLMPTKWLQDDAWNHVNTIFNEPFIGTSSKNLKQIQDNDTVQQANFILMHYDNIQEVQIRNRVQKKVDYGRLMGHFKKAVDYSLEDNDQQSLDDIILAYISEKQAKREAMAQLETNILEEHRNSNVIELYDGRVYDIDSIKDPTRHNCKGRPTTKRMKGRNEENNNASTSKVQKENVRNDCENMNNGRKCSICHKMGHYAPRCPN